MEIIFILIVILVLIGGVMAVADEGKKHGDKLGYGIGAAIITIIFVLFALSD